MHAMVRAEIERRRSATREDASINTSPMARGVEAALLVNGQDQPVVEVERSSERAAAFVGAAAAADNRSEGFPASRGPVFKRRTRPVRRQGRLRVRPRAPSVASARGIDFLPLLALASQHHNDNSIYMIQQ
jgi:hypothetical protein